MEIPAVSVGRGRGRGGVPLLPAGNEGSNYQSSSSAKGESNDHNHGPQRDMKGKDWDCPSCSNHNWSWRTACNMCSTPKPNLNTAGEDEVRDGVGKGFNERQERASAANVEIDEDGFDDFGRRVKKTNKSERSAKEEAALKRLNDKYKHVIMPEVGDMSRFDDAEESSKRAITHKPLVDSAKIDWRRPNNNGNRMNESSSSNNTTGRKIDDRSGGGGNDRRDERRGRSRSRDRDRDAGKGDRWKSDSDRRNESSNSGYSRKRDDGKDGNYSRNEGRGDFNRINCGRSGSRGRK